MRGIQKTLDHFTLRVGHAPPQYRTKRWPEEALMEGWFPRECGEHCCLQFAEVVEGRTIRNERFRRATPDEPSARLCLSTMTRSAVPLRTSSVKRGVDAGCKAIPAQGGVSLDIPLYGKPFKLDSGTMPE